MFLLWVLCIKYYLDGYQDKVRHGRVYELHIGVVNTFEYPDNSRQNQVLTRSNRPPERKQPRQPPLLSAASACRRRRGGRGRQATRRLSDAVADILDALVGAGRV